MVGESVRTEVQLVEVIARNRLGCSKRLLTQDTLSDEVHVNW